MKNEVTTKALAETIIRRHPAVLGASVREDIHGHPREVHILVGPGPKPRELAHTIWKLLEEQLEIEIDQRVISIAQLSRELELSHPSNATLQDDAPADTPVVHALANAAPAPPTAATAPGSAPAARSAGAPDSTAPGGAAPGARVIYQGVESTSRAGRTVVHVRVTWQGEEYIGEGEEIAGDHGRIRATATATLAAAMLAAAGRIRFDLVSATTTRAFDREYVVVEVRATAPGLGRNPIPLVAAQPIGFDIETATALASLHAINRILARKL